MRIKNGTGLIGFNLAWSDLIRFDLVRFVMAAAVALMLTAGFSACSRRRNLSIFKAVCRRS